MKYKAGGYRMAQWGSNVIIGKLFVETVESGKLDPWISFSFQGRKYHLPTFINLLFQLDIVGRVSARCTQFSDVYR